MRLSQEQIIAIRETARSIFGLSVQVLLYGSRTDKQKKGGDIDLLIQSDNPSVLTLENKIRFLVALKKRIGDQKIDVILSKNGATELQIIKTARRTGLELC